jgi:hypothetical protein
VIKAAKEFKGTLEDCMSQFGSYKYCKNGNKRHKLTRVLLKASGDASKGRILLWNPSGDLKGIKKGMKGLEWVRLEGDDEMKGTVVEITESDQ